MANIKITELNETLTKTNNDVLPIVDITANETKKIKIENLLDKNIELLAVSDTAPIECNTGDKYYNTSTKLIYTATAQDTWSDTGTTPLSGILYIVYADQASYSWDGTDLVSVGGGKEDIVIDDEEPTDPDVKIWIDTGEVGSQASEITNEYSESIGLGYSADYSNKAFGGVVVWTNENPTSNFSSQDINLGDTYSKVKIVFKRKTDEDYGYISGDIYNDNFYIGTMGLASNLIIQRLARLNGTTLSIANGFKYSTYGSSATQDNSLMIPIKIYGYK